MMTIVTIKVDLIESGHQRYEHWNGPICDVKVSRHLNVHLGQQRALFGIIHLNRGQQHTIGFLVGVWVRKMENTEEKLFFKTETICFDQKWSPLLLELGDI